MGTFICVYLPRVDHLVYLIELNCPKKKRRNNTTERFGKI